MAAVAESLHEMSEAAVSGLRSRSGREEAEEGRVGGAGEIALAISGGVAATDGCCAGDAGRRRDAALAREQIREGGWPNESLGEGRSAESDTEFQGARDDDGGVDGEISRRDEAR